MALPLKAKTVKVYRGDDTQFLLTRFFPAGATKDPSTGRVQGPGLDVSSWDWSAQWRTERDSADFIDLVVETDRADEGYIVVKATAAQTAQMETNGYWDLQAVMPNGEHITKFAGATSLTKDVTRDG